MKTWWQLLCLQRNRGANRYFWRHISVKSNMCTDCATRQLFLDFSDQIVRNENSSVHVQGWNAPCKSCRIQIRLRDCEHVGFLFCNPGQGRKQNLYHSPVLSRVPNWRFSSGCQLEANWNRCKGFYPITKPNHTEPTVFWPVPHFRKLRTLAPTQYLGSDLITIWYIRNRCSFRCSFTCQSLICDSITIRWVAVKSRWKLGVFPSDSTNIDRIANWRTGGERVSITAFIIHISYFHTITTQILNWSKSSEFAKMRLCCIANPAGRLEVYVQSRKPPRQHWPGWGFSQSWNQTEPFIHSPNGPLVGHPDPSLTLLQTKYTNKLYASDVIQVIQWVVSAQC